jgi:hypothetical protein
LQEQQILLMWAKADDRRANRPDLAELDKAPLWPPHPYSIWWHPSWHKAWRRERNQGIWPNLSHRTGYRWAKVALALHFHKLVLKMARRRSWRHLPVDDRIAAALLGLAEAIRRFDMAAHANGITAFAIFWMRKELQRLAYNERRQPQGEHKPYGFGDGEFGLGIPMSFRPREYPLISYDENGYRRRPQRITVDGGLVENVKLGVPADDNDDVEYVGPSFSIWSPVNPETALLFKEAAWEKYKYRAAEEIVAQLHDPKAIRRARSERRYRCDASAVIDATTIIAARRDWRPRKKSKDKPRRPEMAVARLPDHAAMACLPASVFAPV